MLPEAERLKLFYPDINHAQALLAFNTYGADSINFNSLIPLELPPNFILENGQINYHIQDNYPGILDKNDIKSALLLKIYNYMTNICPYANDVKTQNDKILFITKFFAKTTVINNIIVNTQEINTEEINLIINLIYKSDQELFKNIYDNCYIFRYVRGIFPEYHSLYSSEPYLCIDKKSKYSFNQLFNNSKFIGLENRKFSKKDKNYILLTLDAVLYNYAKQLTGNMYENCILHKNQNRIHYNYNNPMVIGGINPNFIHYRPIWQQKILLNHIGLFSEVNKFIERKKNREQKYINLISENAGKIAKKYEIDPNNLNKFIPIKSVSKNNENNSKQKTLTVNLKQSNVSNTRKNTNTLNKKNMTLKLETPLEHLPSHLIGIPGENIPELNKLINEYLYGVKN